MRTLRHCLLALALIFGLQLAGPAPAAEAGTLSQDVTKLLQGPLLGRTRLIVQTHGRPTSSLLSLLTLLGGRSIVTFESIDGLAVDLPLNGILTLLTRPDVERISLDLPVRGMLDVSSSTVGAGAARKETGLNGAGIGVAVLDTGVAPHKDLTDPSNRIVGWKDFVNGKSGPYDDCGHGTHVAGIIAGDGGASPDGRNLKGIAPRANIIGVKVLNSKMSGSVSTVISGLDWVKSQRSRLGIRIVNLSLSAPVRESYKTDPLCRAVETVWRSGIVVLSSAGNLGRKDPKDPNSGVQYGTVCAPGNDPLVITVGATNANGTGRTDDDLMATYSSRGVTRFDHVLKPDVVAPGNKVTAPVAGNCTLVATYPSLVTQGNGGKYMTLSGTSMATPVVAGAVALMLQADPSLSPDTIKIRLMHSATKRWSSAVAYAPVSRGAGLLNIPQALRQWEKASTRAASPWMDRGSECGTFVVYGTRALWGSDPNLAGDGFLWGDENSYEAVGADGFLWGDENSASTQESQTVWADGFLWGDESSAQSSEVWGDGFLWGDENSYQAGDAD